jgi:hypothetical protein
MATTPPAGLNGGGGGLLSRVNPLVIVVGLGMATFFTWFFTGGGSGSQRRATQLPEFSLGEDVGGRTITGIRTQWEYQVNDGPNWLPEETI